MPVRSRAAAICAASVFTTTLVFGGTAIAADNPVPGTQACTDAVNLNSGVQAARVAVNDRQDELLTAKEGGNAAAIAKAQSNLDAALATLRARIADITDRVCTGTTTPPATTDPAPTEDPAPSNFNRVVNLINGLECGDDFTADRDRIADLRTEAGNGISSEQQAALTDRLNAKLRSLGFCFPAAEPADPQPTTTTTVQQAPPTSVNVNGNVTVNPTQDDGSVASTDGSQIEVVPDGSVSTGAA